MYSTYSLRQLLFEGERARIAQAAPTPVAAHQIVIVTERQRNGKKRENMERAGFGFYFVCVGHSYLAETGSACHWHQQSILDILV